MKKFFLSVILSFGIANAGLVDAIALTVNDEAVTLYDIEFQASQMNGDKNAAVGAIIDGILYKQEIKKYNIEVGVFEVNDYVKNLAAQNGMELYQFRSIVRQQYEDISIFENEIKQRIQHQRLVGELVRGNIKIATQEDLEIFYNNNKRQFVTSSNFEIVQYSSKNRESLNKLITNPMLILNDVEKVDLKLEQNNLNPQMKYLLNATQESSFTPIFVANQNYVTQFIIKKEGETFESFEQAQEKIFGIVMNQREEAFLKEHFEKLKLSAQINIIR